MDVQKTMLGQRFAAKTSTTETPGEFVAIVSAFGVVDSQGDLIEKGAYARSLAARAASGSPFAVIWSHQYDVPESYLGEYTAAEEIEEGLKLTGLFNLTNPRAALVYDLMKRRLITEFSVSGLVKDYQLKQLEDGQVITQITDLELWEAGPCFKGANPETALLSIKSGTDGAPPWAGFADTLARIEKALTPEQPIAGPASQDSAAKPILPPNVRALLELNTIH